MKLSDNERQLWVAAAIAAITGTAPEGAPKHHAGLAAQAADQLVREYREREAEGISKR